MQIVENVALISVNATLFVQLGSFLLFMVIFNHIMVRPLRRVMTEREVYLRKVVNEISAANKSYRDIELQIKSQEDAARSEAFVQRDQLLAAGEASAAATIEQTRQEINRLRTEAQAKTAEHIAAVRKEMEREAEAISDLMVASVLGRGSNS